MSWLSGPMLAMDTETTTANPEDARVVQVCAGYAVAPGAWAPTTLLIDPGVPIPADAVAVHGITTEHVQTYGAHPGAALSSVRMQLDQCADRGIPVVAHNAAFDLTVLSREFARHGIAGLPDGLLVLDTLCLYRRFDWTTGGRSLSKLAERHGITFPAHDAEADALACLRLLHILAGINDLLPLIPLADLHRMQAVWWADQQDAAAAKAAGNGDPFTRQPHWPLIPLEVSA